MTIVAGIDEAGFGPMLGPLVVSCVAFELPDEQAGECMWSMLSGAVARKASKRRGGLVVADSKKIFNRKAKNPLQHLERGVLAMLSTYKPAPATLHELAASIAPAAAANKKLESYPWYHEQDLPLPHSISATDLSLATNSLSVALSQAGAAVAGIRAELIFPAEFNRLVQATDNKSTLLLSITTSLIARLWAAFPGRQLKIFVDRQGGRMRYRDCLQRIFDGCGLKIVEECETRSAYVISDRGRSGEIEFRVGGENHHMSVALASMTSKYFRELYMGLFNRFWSRHVPELAPTAGYFTDARRFCKEIAPAVRRLGLSEQLFRRQR